MNLYDILVNPKLYEFKSTVLSFGRTSVRDYLWEHAVAPAGGRVLDVGCGTGRLGEVFNCRYFGIDREPRYITYACQRRPGVFSIGNAARLAFPDNTFDLVLCVGLCHHLPDPQVTETVAEMKRVTKRGGVTLVVDGVLPGVFNVPGYLLFRFDRGKYIRRMRELDALLGREGFSLETGNIPRSFPYQRAVFSCRH